MARKFNPQTKQWERQVGDSWVPIEGEAAPQLGGGTALDEAITEAFGEVANGDTTGGDLQLPEAAFAPDGDTHAPQPEPAGVATDVAGVDPDLGPAGAADSVPVDLVVEDIPGLTSGDGARGVRGAQGVRSRLVGLASRGRKGRAEGQKVQVGPRAAKASGPAVKDSTAARQQRAQAPRTSGQVTPTGKTQRYTNRPAPGILESRPKWVQELFEAHFRSDLTLGMRREFGRMKISRQDYAIGWLTLLEKIKEDPSIARLKKNGAE